MNIIYSFGDSGIKKSQDGITWDTFSNTTNSVSNDMNAEKFIYTKNLFFKTGNDAGGIKKLYKSNDGVIWTLVNFTKMNHINDIKYNNNYILSCGVDSVGQITVAKSNDGLIWEEYTINNISYTIGTGESIFWNGIKWMMRIGIGSQNTNNKYSTISQDGVIWTDFNLIATHSEYPPSGGDINYFNGKWTMVFGYTLTGTIMTGKIYTSSDDGSSWIIVASIGYNILRIYSTNNYIIFLMNGNERFLYSNDLINFNFANLQGVGYGFVKDVKYFNNKFIFLAENTIMTTTDFINFTPIPNTNFFDTSGSLEIVSTIPCLVKGMEVNVENGIKKIEDLQVGDTVVDILGRKIRASEILCKKVIGDNNNIPYVIPKDFFEKDIPSKDIYISYNHAYFYNGQWMLPIHNDDLKRDETFLGKEIEYYHVSLPNYAVDKLVCYNLPVDSFDNSKYNQENMI